MQERVHMLKVLIQIHQILKLAVEKVIHVLLI